MKKFYFLLLSISFFCNSKAQQWVWDTIEVHSYNSNVGYRQLKLAKDNLNNIITYRINEYILNKYNISLNQIWQKTFSTNLMLRKVICSIDNDIYVLGTFYDSINIDSAYRQSLGSSDIFIARLDEYGNLIWLNQIGSHYEDFAGGLCVLGNNLYVTGATRDTTIFSNQVIPQPHYPHYFISEYNRNTGLLDTVVFTSWFNQQDSGIYLDYSYDAGEIIKDNDGNLIASFDPIDSVQLDTAILVGYASFHIIKLDTAFHVVWKKLAEQDLTGDIYDLHTDSYNNIFYIFHYSWLYTDMGQIFKLAPDGSSLGTHNFPLFGHFNGMDISPYDHVLFTGWGDRWTYNGNPPDTYYLVTGELKNDFTQFWLRKDSSLLYREGDDIMLLDNNRYLVSGLFADTLILHDMLISNSPQRFDFFLGILSPQALTEVSENQILSSDIQLFPNPTTSTFTLNCPLSIVNTQLKIYNPFGQLIHQQIIKSPHRQIDLSSQPKGIYFIELIADGKAVQSKLVLN
jgi:hypothetical protein